MYSKNKIDSFIKEIPLLKDIMNLKPVVWLNPNRKPSSEMPSFPIKKEDMDAAEQLWKRFAPFFVNAFPTTAKTNGVLESPLMEIQNMKSLLNQENTKIEAHYFLKCDNALPIAGSIKARGGFFEVLHYAEKLALKAGILKKGDNYADFTTDKYKTFFNKYKIGVGSTGNLGLSIGIISAKLGFQVTVYVSADAKIWKKDLLRSKGVEVIEFNGDFSEAILAGRQKTNADPMAYFVDDENSYELFLGYTVGALRLAKQLEEANIKVDAEHPLFVYSPCGVGGSPGGTAFGLKQIYGDNVHCFFVEPTHSPAVLTGLVTGEMSNISVQDIGVDNKTEADGLAVGRPSNFATSVSSHLVSGIYTIEDEQLFILLAKLMDTEKIFLEPSATAGLIGPQRIATTNYAEKNNLNMQNATHIVWATGGDLVPSFEREEFYKRGSEALV
ncbi:D-serine ammonia-lyase [Aequorivita marisscotiae]|uniref:Probable D-serine dehydratase n=1 Tax=Aequorivita marisscotiae TaxID=3040348 RepID=A0ABY8KY41_9FLAO|nr:D-serine ammonia-lyase [Aequorivita sp. Ant34-E75]WGF93130.1 D-serine ammonia-lyase [Aequorivita sp. Ant34-E75]